MKELEPTAGPEALESALHKARWRLLPLLSIAYLVAYMDRANISFAAETMNRDLHFSPRVYGLGAGLFFLSYALCELPSNRALLRFGARRWMARIMLTWGLLAGAMVLVRSSTSFYGVRLLLGMAEAGYFPGVLFYLAQWFPAAERARAISRFYISLPLSNAVMGALAGFLLSLDGRLHLTGWQWLFLVEAVPAVALSLVLWRSLPDGPASARWLSAPERSALQVELARGDRSSPAAAHGEEGSLWRVLANRRVWLLGFVYFCGLLVFYALSFSLPLLLRQLTSLSQAQVGYVISGLGFAGAAAMLLNAAHSDKTSERQHHSTIPFLLMAVVLVIAGLHLRGITAVACLLLAVCAYYTMQGPLLGMATSLVRGSGGAIAIATVNMCGIMGGFLGPYWMGWMREHTGSYAVGIGWLAAPCVLGVLCIQWLMRPVSPARHRSQEQAR